MKKLEEYVKSIPDFPEKGIIFRDVTSVLQDAEGLHLAIDQMQEKLEGVDFDVVGRNPEALFLVYPLPTICIRLLCRSERKASCREQRSARHMILSTALRLLRYIKTQFSLDRRLLLSMT